MPAGTIIDLCVYRFSTFYGDNFANNSFPILSIEFIRKDTNAIIPVTGLDTNSPILINIIGSGSSSICKYFDSTANVWKTDGVGTLGTTSNTLQCNSTHLTEFTGFSIDSNSGPTNPSNNNLYYLLLLLLIFPICLIFGVIVGFIAFTIFKIFQGRTNFLKFKFALPKKNPTEKSPITPTNTDRDMIDLGI
jgi:hypothetical protein